MVTVSMETADPNILIGSVLSMILNYVIIGVAIAYTPKEANTGSENELKIGETKKSNWVITNLPRTNAVSTSSHNFCNLLYDNKGIRKLLYACIYNIRQVCQLALWEVFIIIFFYRTLVAINCLWWLCTLPLAYNCLPTSKTRWFIYIP